MQLKPFEAGQYSESGVVIRNDENDKQELFTTEEFEIVKFLKANENESLLGLLLPNIGIAKKDHIVICLKVIGKLKRLGIVDIFSITGKKPVSNTATLELEVKRDKLELTGLRSAAAVVVGISEKLFSKLGPSGLLLMAFVGTALGFVLFPFEKVDDAIRATGVSYATLFLSFWIGGSLAACWRVAIQSAYLKAIGAEARYPRLTFLGPFLSLAVDQRQVNLAGYRTRIQIGLVGLFSAVFLTAPLAFLCLGSIVPVVTGFYIFSAMVFVLLILLCPFVQGEGSDLVHTIINREDLPNRVSADLQSIFRSRGSLSRSQLMGLLVSLIWVIVWLDCIRSFWESVSTVVTDDITNPATIYQKLGSWFFTAAVAIALLLPAFYFFYLFFRDRVFSRKRKIQVEKSKVKDSLSFEERISALEKIPLFAYLNDQERLSLLNEMQPAFYNHGEYLVHQGELGKEFYVLVKGHANAYFTDRQGKSVYLADLGVGDAFGEIALIDDVPRTASIVSDGGCIVLVLKKEGFDRFCESLGSVDRVKTMIRLTSFFRRHPLFSKLGARDQAILIDSFQFYPITLGEEISDSSDSFYVIYSGKVRVDTGDDSMDTHLNPDDCFGYANGLNAHFFALEGTGLLGMKKHEFLSLIWDKLVERPELFL